MQRYVFIRYSSLGQTQYMPPGNPADLMTRVATMGVVHCGQAFPVWIESLSLPIDALAVLLIFPPDAIDNCLLNYANTASNLGFYDT